MKDIELLDKDYIQNLYIKIGKNVKRIREEKNISQLTLAQAIGHKSVTVISCCEICYKNYHFNIEHLAKIAYVLDVNIEDFFK
ncbi:transcriptional regulator [Arcobacter sp. F155]|uniref:helix-turn-helix transcriptional regulator n=1 Tax=Arcobacter sp. F155 TaxID=2044512 RepID=UPI00100B519B|nr:helix-turn-helix transcriptional regulator [Arcobacter sp. F155]RXJ77029.1 transcriptional regulator [Arcobacter sp. F155]